MKVLIALFVAFLLLSGEIRSQIIPNSGFEDWTLIGGLFAVPDNWETNAGDFSNNVIMEFPGHSGNYALQLNSTGYAKTKFAFSQHPANIQAYVKSDIPGTDTVNIHISVFSGNNIVDIGDWISTASIPSWTLITIPVSVSFSQVDSLEILITSGDQAGTSVSVDDISYSLATGIDESKNNCCVTISSDPFNNFAILDLGNLVNEECSLIIYNSTGQLVQTIDGIETPKVIIERKDFAKGLYLYQLHTKNKAVAFGKFVVE